MITMPYWLFIFGAIGLPLGWFCVGFCVCYAQVRLWRVRWIFHEHDLARLQGRKPRSIEEFLKEEHDKRSN